MTATTTVRAGIYCRISSDRQGDRAGVRRQEDDCRELAQRLGWTVAGVYTDNHVSAYGGRAGRPEWQRLIGDASDGQVDAILAWHDDRLWRDVTEQQFVFAWCRDAGVKFVATPTRTYEPAQEDDNFVSGIQALVAQRESADKSRRLRAHHRDLAKQGRNANGGFRPFGFNADRVTLREDEAAAIRDAVRRMLRGESARSVLRGWTEAGIVGPAGGPIHASTFKKILTSPRIAGLRTYKGEVVAPATWPAIITEDEHQRIRRMFTNSGLGRPPKYALSGLLRCGNPKGPAGEPCGRVLRSRTYASRPRMYWCHPDGGGCGGITILAEPAELVVRDTVLGALDGDGLAQARRRAAEEDDAAARLTEDLSRLQRKLTDLADDWAEDRITRAEWITARQAVEARLESVKRALRSDARLALLADLPDGVAALRAAWDAADVDWRRRLLSALLAHVVVHPATRRGGRMDPTDPPDWFVNRLDPAWRV